MLNACPACAKNFASLFCHFTCSANQSQFVNVTETVPKSNATASVDFWLSRSFAEGIYDSCKNVKFGMDNGFALNAITRGRPVTVSEMESC
jgi:Niemann-Pick C1 protein